MNMCNLFLFHLQDHFHWFKFPVRFNGKIKHGWRVRLWIYKRSHRDTHTLACVDQWKQMVLRIGFSPSVRVRLYLFCVEWVSSERTDAHCITEAIPFICLLPPPHCFVISKILCKTNKLCSNFQQQQKNFGEFFLWLNLFFLGMLLLAIKENEDRQWQRPTMGGEVLVGACTWEDLHPTEVKKSRMAQSGWVSVRANDWMNWKYQTDIQKHIFYWWWHFSTCNLVIRVYQPLSLTHLSLDGLVCCVPATCVRVAALFIRVYAADNKHENFFALSLLLAYILNCFHH